MVLGSYAKGAQQEYMRKGHPLWLRKSEYEKWAKEVLAPEKYAEVTKRYGEAPGHLLTRGDSIAVACLRYGNVLLFPQPRPAIGDDDFKLVHGVEVPPPHSYLAPYLYVLKGFDADALIHFGTHGNLEFTPGRDAGMRKQDWSSQLIGAIPHFYYYTTGNIGEAVIAKRRSHAALLTYLTPPYAESGMRQKYATLLNDVRQVEHLFKYVRVGKPLLYTLADCREMAGKLTAAHATEKHTHVVFVGHGTEHPANAIYSQMDRLMKQCSPRCHVGTIEGFPALDDVVQQLRQAKARCVVLVPLMFVAGDHAKNDISVEWKEALEKEGMQVQLCIEGLGQRADVQDLFVRHVREAMNDNKR
jgi:hypothetical protein